MAHHHINQLHGTIFHFLQPTAPQLTVMNAGRLYLKKQNLAGTVRYDFLIKFQPSLFLRKAEND